MIAYSLTDVLLAWPLAFLLGVAIGLGLASRYRITRAPNGRSIP